MRKIQLDVIVDEREDPSMVQIFFDLKINSPYDLNIKIETLDAGDYVVGGIVWSFKTYHDFINSLGEHLDGEIIKMREAFSELLIPYALIVSLEGIDWKKDADGYGKTMKAKDTYNWRLPVFVKDDRMSSVLFMLDYASKNIDKPLLFMDRPLDIGKSNSTIRFFSTFPGIGRNIATDIAEKYETPIDLIAAILYDKGIELKQREDQSNGERWWDGIPNLGKKRALSIENTLLLKKTK